MIRNDNYILIQGWMINELKLTGNKLLVYAIINGFSQDGNNWFDGSMAYLCEFTNCKSKTTIYEILKDLVENGLLEKQESVLNNIKFCKYRTVYKKCNGISENDMGGISENDTNNKYNKYKENNNTKVLLKESKKFTPPTLEEIKNYCRERNNDVDAQKFFDYYDSNDWKDNKGNPVKSWKQKMIANWEGKNTNKNQSVSKGRHAELRDGQLVWVND